MYATIAALFIALFAMPTTVQAEAYGLFICGTQVTSDNCDNLSSVIDGVSGTVKYDPDNKVLTLEGATISSDNAVAIKSWIDGLKIKVIGENNLTTEKWETVKADESLRIIGYGVLNVKSNDNTAIVLDKAELTIENCTVNAEGNYCGIKGWSSPKDNKLTIKNAMVTAVGTTYGSICNIDELNLKDCEIVEPMGAKFDKSKCGVVLNGEIVKSKVVIKRNKYPLLICGKDVTSANCNDLSVIEGVSGTVKYDPDKKVLTLQEATISSATSMAIYSVINDLTIKVIGENNLTTEKLETVKAYKQLRIIGPGVLNVKSNCWNAIILDNAELTIENCTVNAEGKVFGIAGWVSPKDNKLTIKNATVTAVGTTYGSICKFEELDLKHCDIVQPVGAKFDKSKYGVVLNGEIVKSKVVIQKSMIYNLLICGKAVTSANCNDLSSAIDGVSGTVKYDPANKVLTLEGATISSDNAVAIKSWIDGLKIKVIGENNLTTGKYTTVLAEKPLNIIGTGVLNVKCNGFFAICLDKTNLTIENCTVNVEGKKYGIKGYSGNNEELTIKNATVTAIGRKQGSIAGFGKLVMIGCDITQPAGATFDESMHAVVLNGEIVKNKVVIDKDPAGVETPVTDNTGVQGIYTLSGIRLSGEPEDLPKGIYIVNGKKVVKP